MRRLLLILLVLPAFAQSTDKLSEDFRLAGLRAIKAMHVRVAGTNRLADQEAIKLFNEADVQRRTPADDKVFQQIKDYSVLNEMARLEVSNAQLDTMIRASNGRASGPSTEGERLKKERICNEQLEKELRSGTATEVSCK